MVHLNIGFMYLLDEEILLASNLQPPKTLGVSDDDIKSFSRLIVL